MTIDEMYARERLIASDIHEHLPTLRSLAVGCSHVTEFGVRFGVSTVALLAGRPDRMVSYDVERHPAVAGIEEAATAAGIDFKFVEANVLSVDIDETDLLFIDTLHTYDQLIAELNRHGDKVRKYIAMHDTVTFGTAGERGGDGLMRAINEYFGPRNEWVLEIHHTNNNGLTVYKRRS